MPGEFSSPARCIFSVHRSPGPLAAFETSGRTHEEAGATQERKLYRIEKGKMIAGVCTGLAEYIDTDIAIVRVAFVLTTLIWGMGLWAYIILLIIMPLKPPNG